MKSSLLAILLVNSICALSQIGIGTTTPNSTLDVRGTISTPVTSFTGNTSAGSADNMLIFTGTSAATITLPTAVGITGREYWIKNASTNASVLTIATTASQTVEGLSNWTLAQTNKAIRVISDGVNWLAAAESLPGSIGSTGWALGGNNVSSMENLGTTSNYALPFTTNNTEKMRISTTGDVAIGTTTFDATNPEQLLVDAGNTSSINVISGKGSINNYLQLNIQNRSSGNAASTDVVATADNGNETTNYVDMGINSSGYSGGVMGTSNDAYLYNAGQNFLIGTSTAAKSLVFITGGTSQSVNERMRIDGNGKVGIGTTTIPKATIGLAKFALDGTVSSINGPHTQITTSADNYPLLQGLNWSHDNIYSAYDCYYESGWKSATTSGGNFVMGKEAGKFVMQYGTNNVQGSAISWNNGFVLTNGGKFGIGTQTFNATNPEKFLVDAGSGGSTFQNVIVGKGNTNSYAQLNIQNSNAGSAASSDVVATADNGTESVNFVDMGINSSAYSATGILGGANNAYIYATGNDFVIGNSKDDKSMIFYTSTSSTNTERMEITGTGNVGIGNINPNSTFEVNGSIGYSITTTSSNITLDATHHTIVLNSGSTSTVTLPAAAAGNARRIYIIVNQTSAARTISSYKSFANANTTTIAATSSITLQSDGTNWYRIQ